ncbi:uncharacterized protein ARB_07878 [Trichophyton benhamiae CBS 112371]|uniref:MARVEL domain-containing protein n=1 Tax=Arthroderma benhamiae (strain ATCC MYA-4681 / CBS 112371) TaxID=663331 RepID=D4AUG1_ARTBC|nr:uncharacterized protein ARB_07878 [Trichophyton benhamiae CBS 112371]EFE33126.1 conserved hypothetical protein [Trichophyton benhamiae CBS 112371]
MASANAIRLAGFGLRMLQLLSSLIIVGVFSYFLAVLADHNEHAPEWLKAVAGIAGVAAIYAILTSFFILAYGGLLVFSRISMMFDGSFAVAFLAICLMTRHGALPCTGRVTTPVGSGDAEDPGAAFGDEDTGTGMGDNLTSMRYLATACKLEKGTFAVSIIGTIRPRFWPRRQTQGSSTDHTVEYSQAPLTPGANSLEDKPKVEKPRFTNFLQRFGGNDSNRNTDPENIQLRQGIQSSNLQSEPSSYGYGKNTYTVTSPDSPISPTSQEPPNPWARSGNADYTYGESGIDVVGHEATAIYYPRVIDIVQLHKFFPISLETGRPSSQNKVPFTTMGKWFLRSLLYLCLHYPFTPEIFVKGILGYT